MYRCWKWYLEMLLVRIGFCTTKSDIRQYWCFACFLSHAQMFKLAKHSFLNSIRIWSGSELWQRFFKGERIQISLKAGHHRPASETPLNGDSLACYWWPNVECWLGIFENSRGSGPVLLRKSIFLRFFRPPVPPLDPCMGPDYVYTYFDILKTHFIVRIGFCTILCVLSMDRQVEREREMRVLFEFRHFLTQRTRPRISKIRVYLCKIIWSTRCPCLLSDCITL